MEEELQVLMEEEKEGDGAAEEGKARYAISKPSEEEEEEEKLEEVAGGIAQDTRGE